MGEQLTSDYICSLCANDSYSFKRTFGDFTLCEKCSGVTNFNCYGGNKLAPLAGFWRYSNKSTAFFECPNTESCLGDLSKNKTFNWQYSSGACEEGYQGVLCNECSEGYGKISETECANCEGATYILTILGGLFLGISMSIFSLYFSIDMIENLRQKSENRNQIISANLMKLLINHFDIIQYIFLYDLSLPGGFTFSITYVAYVSPSLSQSFSLDCFLRSIGIGLNASYFRLIVIYIYPILLFFFLPSLLIIKHF